MSQKGNIVLVLRSGGDFSMEDVFLLTHHLRKQSNDDVRITCLFDKVKQGWDLHGFSLRPLPCEGWRGWWSKMNLFSPELEQYRPFLYLDLDTAVVGHYTELMNQGNHFITLEDFYHDGKLASGLMWIPRDSIKVKQVWDEWIKNPGAHMKRFRGDQDFIRTVTTADLFWQDVTPKVSSFKPKTGKLNQLPEGVSVVCFHGKPRIWQAAGSVRWVRKYTDYD